MASIGEVDRSLVTPRQISAAEWEARRFEWLESVRRDHGLSPTARLLAHVLAMDFANRKTAECRPGPGAMAEAMGCSLDTIKRALAELVAAGWIVRETAGPGRGKSAHIIFLSRAQIIDFRAAQKGASAPPFSPKRGHQRPHLEGGKKGANLLDKTGQKCPPNHSKEPYTREGARGEPGETAALRFWAKAIADGKHIPISAVSPVQAREMLRMGWVDEAALKARGISF